MLGLDVFVQLIREKGLQTPEILVLKILLFLLFAHIVDFCNDHRKLIAACDINDSLVHEKGHFEGLQFLFGLAGAEISFGVGSEGPQVPLEISHQYVLHTHAHIFHFDFFAYDSGSTMETELVKFELLIAALTPQIGLTIFHGYHIYSPSTTGTGEIIHIL